MNIRRSPTLLAIILLVIISALAYLPFASQYGPFNDDWYHLFSVGARGPLVFHDIFASDRPGRAYLMIPLYTLFGNHIFLYSLSAYLFRLISGLSFYWTLRQLWPARQAEATFASLLFVVYPGFLSQPNAFDYQSHIVALGLAWFSIALNLFAIRQKDPWRFILLAITILSGLAYLSQMEYYIGLEAVRLLLLGYVVWGETPWKKRFLRIIQQWAYVIIVPVGFSAWRLFIFQSERKATDVGAQVGQLAISPVSTLLAWATSLGQDLLKTDLLAWAVPFYNNLSVPMRLREILLGFVLIAGAAVLIFWAATQLEDQIAELTSGSNWAVHASLIGIIGTLLTLAPVTLANREVTFSDYSRYTLPGAALAALFLAALISNLTSARLRQVTFTVFIILGLITQFQNSIHAVRITESIREFWWQVAWRAPNLASGTVLAANYPDAPIEEDYFIWGPAALIYSPKSASLDHLEPVNSAIVVDQLNLLKILRSARPDITNRRSITTKIDYQNLLILSRPTTDSCVHALDGSAPLLSSDEDNRIMQAANFSDINRIEPGGSMHTPPALIFGPEPEHTWCYYFEKAELAHQLKDWNYVLNIARTVKKQNLLPGDPIEWLPFLDAYARSGDVVGLHETAKLIKDSAVSFQVCGYLGKITGLSAAISLQIKQSFCSQ